MVSDNEIGIYLSLLLNLFISQKDSAYTERYMGMPGPDGNWKGYENSDLSAKAVRFFGKNFFLIHGTADDNVHFQQSMVLVRALVDYNILFRLQVCLKIS